MAPKFNLNHFQVRLLEVDTKISAGLVGEVNEVSHNAVLVRWSPLVSAVNLQIAIRCLSTDFSSQKGVKGIPLHIQVSQVGYYWRQKEKERKKVRIIFAPRCVYHII
jgi:hypothetical protein